MDVLRGALFLGLVAHKCVWELLRRRNRVTADADRSDRKGSWLVKPLKGAALVFLSVQTLFLDVLPISDEPGALKAVGTAMYVVGLGTAVMGRLELGRNWMDLEDYRVLAGQRLVTKGIYGYIRHPIYTGDLLLLVGLELALNSWLVLAVLIPGLIVVRQVLAEEALLSRTFPAYDAYRTRTKRFIPFVL